MKDATEATAAARSLAALVAKASVEQARDLRRLVEDARERARNGYEDCVLEAVGEMANDRIGELSAGVEA